MQYKLHMPNIEEICDSALNGKLALESVIKNVEHNNNKRCDYHLILMDCNMPIMDGC